MRFALLGLTPQTQSVAGILRDGKKSRLALITLNEAGNQAQRKKHNDALRLELEKPVSRIKSGAQIHLQKRFKLHAMKDMRARIELAEYADQTIHLIANEPDTPDMVIFDCANRASFWETLKRLGVSEALMFQLAELSIYKPQHVKTDKPKPLGEAHKLCQALERQKWPQEDVNAIAAAHKFRLPALNWADHIAAATFEAELRQAQRFMNARKFRAVFDAAVDALGFVNKHVVNRLGYSWPTTREAFTKARSRWDKKTIEAMQDYTGDKLYYGVESFEHISTSEHQDAVLQALYKKWGVKDMREAEGKYAGESYLYFDRLTVLRSRIPDGLHFLPFGICLFEFESRTNTDAERVFILARKENENRIMFKTFLQDDTGYKITMLDAAVNLKDGRFHSFWVRDEKGAVVSGKNIGSTVHLMQITHCLSALSRIHAPGHVRRLVVPPRTRVSVGKHAHPYFEYHDVTLDGASPDYILVGKRGENAGAQKRRHVVRGHPRRYRDDFGNILEVVIIPPHLRGDPALGFISSAHKLENV